jgi:uncharacterized protein YecE (DUF72 family)
MIYSSTSGYSFADWQGLFYPENTDKTEELAYFSQFFNAVELNGTYYNNPTPKSIATCIKTAPGMKFALKGNKLFTNQRKLIQKDIDDYCAALSQLARAEALVSLLLQFPIDFLATSPNIEYLGTLVSKFDKHPVAVEFLHPSWATPRAYKYLQQISSITIVTTDAPDLTNLFRDGRESRGKINYIRLHGRNSEKWWQHDEGWERYNYLYASTEITNLAEGTEKLQSMTGNNRDTFIFFNNYVRAQSLINALQLSVRLTKKAPPGLPSGIASYLRGF